MKASLYFPRASDSRLNVRIRLSGMMDTSSSITMTCVNSPECSVAAIIPRAKPPEPPVLGLGSTVTTSSERASTSSERPLSTTNMWKLSANGAPSAAMPFLTREMLGMMYFSFLNVVVQRAMRTSLTADASTQVEKEPAKTSTVEAPSEITENPTRSNLSTSTGTEKSEISSKSNE